MTTRSLVRIVVVIVIAIVLGGAALIVVNDGTAPGGEAASGFLH